MRIGSCAGAPANAAMSAAVGLWAEVGRAEPGDPGDHGERGDEGQADATVQADSRNWARLAASSTGASSTSGPTRGPDAAGTAAALARPAGPVIARPAIGSAGHRVRARTPADYATCPVRPDHPDRMSAEGQVFRPLRDDPGA